MNTDYNMVDENELKLIIMQQKISTIKKIKELEKKLNTANTANKENIESEIQSLYQ